MLHNSDVIEQVCILLFPLLGHMHIDICGDFAVMVPELSADDWEGHICFRHQGCERMAECMNGNLPTCDGFGSWGKVRSVCGVMQIAPIMPRKEELTAMTCGKTDLFRAVDG